MRADMKVAEVENDGLMVYLYDEQNLKALKAVGSELVHGDDKERERAFKSVAGLLCAYELKQDDTVRVGVVVGPPLSAVEKRGGTWLKPVTTQISLPSGRLCVESLNTLRIDADEEPAERGAVVQVPPGDYVLTLHASDDDGEGPSEVITLTALAQVAKPPKPKALLQVRGARPSWQGRYRIEEEVFVGELAKVPGSAWINADRKVRDALGWRCGSHLRLSIAKLTFEIFYDPPAPDSLDDLIAGKPSPLVQPFLDENPRLCGGKIPEEGSHAMDLFVMDLIGADGGDWTPLAKLRAGTPVRIETLEPYTPPQPDSD